MRTALLLAALAAAGALGALEVWAEACPQACPPLPCEEREPLGDDAGSCGRVSWWHLDRPCEAELVDTDGDGSLEEVFAWGDYPGRAHDLAGYRVYWRPRPVDTDGDGTLEAEPWELLTVLEACAEHCPTAAEQREEGRPWPRNGCDGVARVRCRNVYAAPLRYLSPPGGGELVAEAVAMPEPYEVALAAVDTEGLESRELSEPAPMPPCPVVRCYGDPCP